MPSDKRTLGWEILWRINQIVVPLLLVWGTWVTQGQFKDQQHRAHPHATEPVEKETFHKIELQLLEIRVNQQILIQEQNEFKETIEEIRGWLSSHNSSD